MLEYKTYFAIPNVHEGSTGWDNLQAIRKWAKVNKYPYFEKGRKVYVLLNQRILCYWNAKKIGKGKI